MLIKNNDYYVVIVNVLYKRDIKSPLLCYIKLTDNLINFIYFFLFNNSFELFF
jgi:hypothetical protein